MNTMKLLLAILFSLLSTILCAQENLALSKVATASSTLGGNTASNVTNGTTTGDRWESTHGQDNQWLQIDLGSVYDLTSSKIYWEGASAKTYDIEVSSNNETWRTIAQKESTAGARTDEFAFSSNAQEVRYIRLNLKTRTTVYGFSIYEWQIFGVPSGVISIATSLDIKPKNVMLLAEMPEKLEILSLNNSLIYNNDMDNIFNQLVLSAGKKAAWTKQTRLGQSLRYHYEENDGAELSAKTVVSSKAWTHIILQEQSSKPIDDYTDFLASVKLWVQYVKDYCPNPNARIILMMNWPYITSTDYNGDYQKLYNNYMSVAKELGVIICPVATSFDLVQTTDQNIADLYTDNRHPSVKASYLSACTFYSTFFNTSPIGLSYYPSSVSAEDATRMQTRAWSAFQSHDGIINDIEGTVKYKVDVLDQFNRKMSEALTYQWSTTGGGSITNGVFTTNQTEGTYNISVQSGNLTTSTTLNVTKA